MPTRKSFLQPSKDSAPDRHSSSTMIPSSSPSHPDLDLRNRALQGDRAAAETLFERHVDTLFEFVFYRVGRDVGLAAAHRAPVGRIDRGSGIPRGGGEHFDRAGTSDRGGDHRARGD